MMRRLLIVRCVSLLLVLALSPAAVADPSWSEVSIDMTEIGSANMANLRFTGNDSDNTASTSSAHASDSLGNVVWQSEGWFGTIDTSASAVVPTASAYAETGSLHVHANISAMTLGTGSAWSFAQALATQSWIFEAAADGNVQFDFSLDLSTDLQTGILGESAFGQSIAWATLSSASNVYWTPLETYRFVRDGDGLLESVSAVPLSVRSSVPFAVGETGHIILGVNVSAGSGMAVIPVPAAVVLGMLGLSAAGLGLRRHA